MQHNSFIRLGFCALLFLNILQLILWRDTKYCTSSCENEVHLWDQNINFWSRNYSNETGTPTGCYVVPNYVHFIRFNQPKISYVDMICILAAFKNQRPDKIFFHTNFNTSFEGKYWEVLKQTKGFLNVVTFNYLPIPEEIFGQPLNPSHKHTIFHAADIARIQVMIKYGGIIIDHDTYIIKNLNKFRNFEATINWDDDQYLGCQIIIAHKDARFLKLYLESYRVYKPDLWYYNAGERPTTEILYKMPELIHRVKVIFGLDNSFINPLFERNWPEWRSLYSLHLLIGHQYMLQKKQIAENAYFPVEFNEENIGYYPNTFREMAYDVYDTAGVTWPKAELN
uniref:Alpha-1,4-N-acetylglucosaminyltransferase n=1 Tax=Clastoptera arizonana TaxID=38151 RepID=A0A1B6DY42_9HEMI